MLALTYGVPRYPQPDPAPLKLGKGEVTKLTFTTSAAGAYQINLEMDQGPARALHPCVVDTPYPYDAKVCPRGMPFLLTGQLIGPEGFVEEVAYSTDEDRGGQNGGTETFALMLDLVDLTGETPYRLVVKSGTDASALAAAHPRLVVQLDAGKREAEMAYRVLGFVAGCGLLILAALAWVAALVRKSWG